ncbi:NAD+ synthase [Massilia antarctica]|uniref:NAD+ synthase n=1 Tax=Massilia antarctica TaxID=2765360 RepID=UPI0006BB74D9|nr:NAD+ synthase [Massilia sp. H27-R4]MCY0914305.1 NAD+ synthase [Massilia sp. H27-R4]CUI08719.1 NAD synthetase / Glutamine amidotransferase chain of NAD synthetase [Janthinobacterium sp. CG23_2]CUU32505.1 NAD synthetase / Glutamine amidotransferase chain of NAD synthetase [Janthinobacterium sp. CG23_2]
MLKIAIAQLNPTVGDIDGNSGAIIAAMGRAAQQGADLAVFTELALCGYYPGDLLEETAFLARMQAGLERVLEASRGMPGLVSVVGAVRANDGPGKPLFNALLAIRDGVIVAEYYKQLLPTYGVFDDRRHFEPGPEGACVLQVGAHRIGFLICEDGWNHEGRDYKVNPFTALREARPDLVVSINASPSDIGKRELRHKLFRTASVHNELPILYVNQVGGQDQLVYDGASFAVSPSQGIAFEAQRFSEDFQVIGFAQGRFSAADGFALAAPDADGLPVAEFTRRQIVLGLQDYARRCGFTKVVVGSSGGIDSALTLALAVDALGPENVIAVTMPSAFSSEGSVSDSVALCDNLGITLYTHPILDLVKQYSTGFEGAFDRPLQGLPLENLQARVRGTILMAYSNESGTLLLTTGNKSEISVGYCTLYGDTNGGLGLIGDLYKTEVYALSRHVNERAGRELIPAAVLTKPPSAELAPGQQDTDSLPAYEVLDEILKWHIEGRRLPAAEAALAERFVADLLAGADGAALVERIHRMVARNEYKRRQAPPIIRVRSRAFGSGRQLPIAAHY